MRNLHQVLATSSEIQICRIRITGKNKQNKQNQIVSSSRSSLSFQKSSNGTADMIGYYNLHPEWRRTQNLKCWLVWRPQLNITNPPPPRLPSSAPAWRAAPWDSRGGASSSHMAYLMKGNSLKIKNGEEQQKWRRREKCNVQHIYTAAWTASRAEDQS